METPINAKREIVMGWPALLRHRKVPAGSLRGQFHGSGADRNRDAATHSVSGRSHIPTVVNVVPTMSLRLSDIPERHPDDMTSVDNLHRHSVTPNVIQCLSYAGTSIVSLEGGCYRLIGVREIQPGVMRGHSAALNLDLRAMAGYLGWDDPTMEEHIPTLESQTARAETAEARVRELEAENGRLREDRFRISSAKESPNRRKSSNAAQD